MTKNVDLRFTKKAALVALQAAVDTDLQLDQELGEPILLSGECRLRSILRVLSKRFEDPKTDWVASDREASKILLDALRIGELRVAHVYVSEKDRLLIPVPPKAWPEEDDGSWQYGPIQVLNFGDAKYGAPWQVVVEIDRVVAWLTSLSTSTMGAPRKKDAARIAFWSLYPDGKPIDTPWKVLLREVNSRLDEEGKEPVGKTTLNTIAKEKRK